MKQEEQDIGVSIQPSTSPETGRMLYQYMKEVATNTAQIVRVNNSGPFPVHPIQPQKGIPRLKQRIRMWLDRATNFPITD